MIIDIIFAIFLLSAIWKGWQRGFILGIFSLVSVIIGIAAAMKLSALVAGYIGNAVKISDKWLPVISFIVVFLVVLLLIRLGAKLIERTFEVVMLGWLNKLAGIILYVVIYTLVFSVLLFYAQQLQFVKQDTIRDSVTYSYVQPWGPRVINGFGSVIPVFRDMFGELEKFFDGVAKNNQGS